MLLFQVMNDDTERAKTDILETSGHVAELMAACVSTTRTIKLDSC